MVEQMQKIPVPKGAGIYSLSGENRNVSGDIDIISSAVPAQHLLLRLYNYVFVCARDHLRHKAARRRQLSKLGKQLGGVIFMNA